MRTLRILNLSIVLLYALILNGQVKGLITDQNGNPLSYASIVLEESSIGTISNMEGEYIFDLPPGRHKLTFQYVGYKSESRSIVLDSIEITLDVTLDEDAVLIEEIVILADAEDPAYAIMREAISSRKRNLKAISNYVGELYIKGQVKVLEAPESFLGENVGNMEGMLDSTGQGIVYLSESQSKVFYKYKNTFKEVMKSSIVAGDDSGFSFNQFSLANFNFYEENITFDRSLNTPLNDNALSNYKFRLLGSTVNEDGEVIYKIEVSPKNTIYPLFSGVIYIVEDEWSIHSLDLKFTGKAIKNRFFDFVRIRHLMRKDDKTGVRYLNNQIIDFKSGFFNFKFGGSFSYVFNNVEINTDIDDSVFNNELFLMESDAQEKTLVYWDSIRPLPLTKEESLDYKKKDSLKVLRESKSYLDSIDRVNNRFGWTNLFFGYSHNNSYSNRFLNIQSPIITTRFNIVEGLSPALKVNLRKYYNDDINRLSLNTILRYGVSDESWKYRLSGSYRLGLKELSFITFGAGKELDQYDTRDPIPEGFNTWSSLLAKRNYAKYYEKRYFRIGYQMEIANGLYGWFDINHERRIPGNENSSYSIFNKDGFYTDNKPFLNIADNLIQEHKASVVSLSLRFRPGQKYFSYPKFKARFPSAWPEFYLFYKKGLNLFSDESFYDKIQLRVRKTRVSFGEFGYSGFQMEIGGFLKKDDNLKFVDYFHFMSNPSFFGYYDQYLGSFKLLQLYEFSTDKNYGTLHYEHHFDGFLLDRIPLLKNSGLKLVAGFNRLMYKDYSYNESSIGIENIGIGPITILRLDYAWAFNGKGLLDHGIKISISSVINDVVD